LHADEREVQGRPVGRILYADDPMTENPGWQSFVWAGHCWPAQAIYPHAWAGRPSDGQKENHEENFW